MYKYILFDFDGTVYDTLEGITKSIQYALKKAGIAAELNELRCFAGPPLVQKYMEVYSFTEEQALQAVADFRERYLPVGLYESRAFPGIRHTLELIRASGLKAAVSTSKPTELAEELLERAGLKELFDVIIGSDPKNHDMTKADVVRLVIDALGAENNECVLIGDTKYDVYGAHEAGIDCIGVRYGYAAQGELEAAGADCIVDTLAELEDLLALPPRC